MKLYKTISGELSSYKKFETEVQEHLAEGWELQGGVSASTFVIQYYEHREGDYRAGAWSTKLVQALTKIT